MRCGRRGQLALSTTAAYLGSSLTELPSLSLARITAMPYKWDFLFFTPEDDCLWGVFMMTESKAHKFLDIIAAHKMEYPFHGSSLVWHVEWYEAEGLTYSWFDPAEGMVHGWTATHNRSIHVGHYGKLWNHEEWQCTCWRAFGCMWDMHVLSM